MRLIEQQMWEAISNKGTLNLINWSKDNTRVEATTLGSKAYVYLHDHHIATYHYDDNTVIPNLETLAAYPTNTTKSRLRALGVDVYTRKGVTYVNGVEV